MFKDTFEHLGQRALYKSEGSGFIDCLVLVKEPEQLYELGDGQFVERIATFEISAQDVLNPKIGDFLFVNGNKYKVYQEPLIDGSGSVFEITAIFVVQNDS